MDTMNASTPSLLVSSSISSISSSSLLTTGASVIDGVIGDGSSVHNVSPILFGAMCSLAFCGLILVGTFLIFNLVYRNHRLIKMSSPNLNVLILLGTALMYSCVVLFGLDSAVTSLDALSIICQDQMNMTHLITPYETFTNSIPVNFPLSYFKMLKDDKVSSSRFEISRIFLIHAPFLFTPFLWRSTSDDCLKIALDTVKIRTCLLPISFTLVYGSIFTKSWRVYRIFSQARAKRMVIRDNRLVGMVIVMVTVDLVILITWLAVDKPVCLISNIDALFAVTLPSTNGNSDPQKTIVCASKYQDVWLLIVFAYKAAMLVSVTYLSWATRNVTLISMNDAKCIIISVYTCVIMTSLVSAMSSLLWKWPNAWYTCVAVVILICTTEVLLLHYVPKMREWRNNPDAELARNLTASYLATSRHSSFIQVEEELFILSAENATLKKSLTEKDDTIRMLQEHVGSATEKLRQLAMDSDNKDSGCDLDELEESSASGQVDPEEDEHEPETPQTEHKEIGNACHEVRSKDDNHIIERPPKSVCRHTKSTGNIQRQKSRRTKERNSFKRLSVSSDASFKQFEELRDSIAKELNQVHNISSNLRDAIAQDLHSCRPRPMYFDIADSEREITEIMRESYNLPEDDVDSMASSAFTYDNPVFSRDQRGRHSGGSRISVYTTKSSRQSSFRSVASMSSEFGLGRHRHGDRPLCKHASLKMQWPLYIPPPPRENQPREGETPRVVNNSKPKVANQSSDSKVAYGTYV